MSFKKLLLITALSVFAVLSLAGCKKAGNNNASSDADVLIIGGQNVAMAIQDSDKKDH